LKKIEVKEIRQIPLKPGLSFFFFIGVMKPCFQAQATVQIEWID
jgi:hypothetical protein